MKKLLTSCVCSLIATGFIAASPVASAATNGSAISTIPAKPAWLTELSFSTKESYDNNVFLAGADSKYYPASYTPPAGSAVALKNSGSWVTTVTPKVGLNFMPFLGTNGPVRMLTLSYAPECAVYEGHSSENNQAHRIATTAKAGADNFTCGWDSTFTYVNGDRMAPFYPGGYLSAFATAAPRERREQLQDRANVFAQYDHDHWFARATGSLLYYDLMTMLTNKAGYQNYCDRYDANGGADLGWKLSPRFATTLGFRYGHQYQQHYSFSPYSSSSDYERVLLGLEGKPCKWLELKVQAGPDFRRYEADAPVSDRDPVKYFADASLAVTPDAADAVTLRFKQWQWVSSTGKIPYFDTAYELNYHRKVTDQIGWDLGGRYLKADYSSGNIPICRRKDAEYIAMSALAYAINSHWSVSASVELDFGRNDQSGITNPSTREFNRQLYTLGTQLKF